MKKKQVVHAEQKIPFSAKVKMQLDIVTIYKDSLSDEQVRKYFNSPYNPPKQDDIVLWLVGNTIDTSTNTWYDLSQYKNNVTLYNVEKASIAREHEVIVG